MSPSASTSRRPGPLLAAAVLAAVLLALVALLVTGGDGDGGGDTGAEATCRALDGTLRAGADGDPVCEVPRTAFATEIVRLRPDGGLVASDVAARRAACAADAGRAAARARTRARSGGPASYDTYRWRAPGVCRAARGRLGVSEVRRARADPLLSAAREALDVGDVAGALRVARRADALVGTAETAALVDRVERARADEARDRRRSADGLVSPNEYLGLPCSAIGRSFRVAPGSDPAHDPDGDGRACEGE